MCITIFENILSVVADSGSANSIIHYFESKKWFGSYKVKKDGHYYRIPYKDWSETTLINIHHIGILSKLIYYGSIQVVEEPGDKTYIVISPNKNKEFVSRTPSEYIYNICNRGRDTYYLILFLDEFYEHEFRSYRQDYFNHKYLIHYNEWMQYIGVNYTDIEHLKKYLIKGNFVVHYDKEARPTHVEISV